TRGTTRSSRRSTTTPCATSSSARRTRSRARRARPRRCCARRTATWTTACGPSRRGPACRSCSGTSTRSTGRPATPQRRGDARSRGRAPGASCSCTTSTPRPSTRCPGSSTTCGPRATVSSPSTSSPRSRPPECPRDRQPAPAAVVRRVDVGGVRQAGPVTATFPLPDDPGASVRPAERGPLPARALETSAEHPWPVRLLARKIEQYVERMAPVWVEGQVVQLNRRPGTSTAFLTLRDTDLDMSLPVSAATRVLRGATLEEGAHVVVHAKPVYWTRRGQLQLQAREIRPVGVGELLARIEHLKRVLAAEGLFAAERKRPLPFLPKVVGRVCGRESKAEHDVVVNARARWPRVRFEIREVAVQGAHAVQQVSDAIRALDADPDVEVIVVARGGGAVEDLLPFSNEALVRVAAACRTPLVSAIGHETDSPLLDLVADVRASTPTAAAKRVVPDVAEERARVAQSRQRLRAAIAGTVAREQAGLD